MKIADPVESVLGEIANNFVASGAVEVYSLPPRGSILIRVVRSKVSEVISFRAQVVVDDIEHDRQSVPVARIDKPLQAFRAAIAILHSKGMNPVVAPIAVAWELSHGHQLNRRHAQFLQFNQVWNDRIKRSFAAVRADVDFIDDVVFQREPTPVRIPPSKSPIVDDFGSPVNTFWLGLRCRVGPIDFPIEAIEIPITRRNRIDSSFVITAVHSVQLDKSATAIARPRNRSTLRRSASVVKNPHLDALRPRRPHDELAAAPFEISRAQCQTHIKFGCSSCALWDPFCTTVDHPANLPPKFLT